MNSIKCLERRSILVSNDEAKEVYLKLPECPVSEFDVKIDNKTMTFHKYYMHELLLYKSNDYTLLIGYNETSPEYLLREMMYKLDRHDIIKKYIEQKWK